MKKTILPVTIVALAISFFSGCMANKQAIPVSKKKPDQKHTTVSQPGNSYYYYMESQLQEKKGDIDKAIRSLKKAIQTNPDSLYLRKELAIFYLQLKESKKALDVLKKIIDKDPENIEALILYGKIEQALDNVADAKSAYKKIISVDPKKENIYLLLGGLYLREKKLEAALRTYKKLVNNFPGSYAGHFYLGKVHGLMGKTGPAEKEFKKTLEIRPDLEEPRFELIKLYKIAGQKKKVVGLYRELLKMNPLNTRAAMAFGMFYYKNGEEKNAENIFKDLGTKSLSQKEILRGLVQHYLDKKKYDATIAILTGMLKGAPESSELNYVAGIAYDKKNEKDKAVFHFKKVLPDSRFYKESIVHAAFLLQEMKKSNEGIDLLEYAVKKVPENSDFMLYLGSFYEDNGQFAKAEKVLKQGIGVDSKNPRLHFRIGVVYDKMGRKEDCIASMKNAIDLDPKNANALNYLGYTYAEMNKNLDEAERLIKAALKEKPDDGYITDSLGWVYFKKGFYTIALKYLKKAVSFAPEDTTILEHVGDAYLKMNEKEKALQYYRHSLLNRKKDKEKLEKKIRDLTGK